MNAVVTGGAAVGGFLASMVLSDAISSGSHDSAGDLTRAAVGVGALGAVMGLSSAATKAPAMSGFLASGGVGLALGAGAALAVNGFLQLALPD